MDVIFRRVESSEQERCRAEGTPVTLPHDYNEYVVFVESLRSTDVLEYLHQAVLDHPVDAFEMIDTVLFLSCLFSSTWPKTSILTFAQRSSRYGQELAGLVDRGRWLDENALSDVLDATNIIASTEFGRRILAATGKAAVRSKLCKQTGYRDGTGKGWRVFHWETVANKAAGLLARSVVSDATSSAWVHLHLGSGSETLAEQLARAVNDTVACLSDSGSTSLANCLMVCDGGVGLPQVRAVLSGGMHALTRVTDYERLQTDEARELIDNAHWLPVEDSYSGPRREAIDLGNQEIDGHRLRVVASRFAVDRTKQNKRKGAGTSIGDWHYELFLSSLPSRRWAANDLVTLYYGRIAVRNRFTGVDRIFNLSRFSDFSPPAQTVAAAIALALWNLRLVAGLTMVPKKGPARVSRPRPGHPEMPGLPRLLPCAPILAPTHLQKLATDELQEAVVSVTAPAFKPHVAGEKIAANARFDGTVSITIHAPVSFVTMLDDLKTSLQP